jgi:hypothetical protein
MRNPGGREAVYRNTLAGGPDATIGGNHEMEMDRLRRGY